MRSAWRKAGRSSQPQRRARPVVDPNSCAVRDARATPSNNSVGKRACAHAVD